MLFLLGHHHIIVHVPVKSVTALHKLVDYHWLLRKFGNSLRNVMPMVGTSVMLVRTLPSDSGIG